MTSVYIFVTLLASFAFTLALAWPYDDDYSAWRLARTSRRSHHCIGSGSKCFSTTQCCRGFVCAAFDDYFGTNPEIPGFCVKEKDLQPCLTSRDCESRSKCRSLGRDGETYCIQSQGILEEVEEAVENAQPIVSANHVLETGRGQGRGYNYKAGATGGVGVSCSDNSDCNAYDKSGKAQLCCQRVTRGRQGVKKICDRVTAISNCISG